MNDFNQALLCSCMLVTPILSLKRRQDREQLLAIYEKHKRVMYYAAIHCLGEGNHDVDDVMQQSVERMCKYFDTIKHLECHKLQSYLVILVKNVCKSHIYANNRRAKYIDEYFSEEMLEQIPDEENALANVFENNSARELLDSYTELSSLDKDIIWMRHVQGMEYSEIAAHFQKSETAVRAALSRAKKRLRKMAEERGHLK